MLSKEAFADLVLSRLAEIKPGVVLRQKVASGAIVTLPDGAEAGLFFERAYAHYASRPIALDEIVSGLVRDFGASQSDPSEQRFDDVMPFVLPRLKHHTYPDVVRDQLASIGAAPDAGPLMSRLGDSVVIVYALDRPDSTERQLVNQGDLFVWNVQQDALHAIALSNLGRRSKIKVNLTSTAVSGPIIVVEPIDAYAAARILLPELLDVIARDLGSDVFLAIPAPDALVAVGVENEMGAAWLKSHFIPTKMAGSPESISDRLFRYSAASRMLSE